MTLFETPADRPLADRMRPRSLSDVVGQEHVTAPGRLLAALGPRQLPVTAAIAQCWGRLGVPDPLPVADGLIAATALVHDLTLVTRNVRDFHRTTARLLNPWDL